MEDYQINVSHFGLSCPCKSITTTISQTRTYVRIQKIVLKKQKNHIESLKVTRSKGIIYDNLGSKL